MSFLKQLLVSDVNCDFFEMNDLCITEDDSTIKKISSLIEKCTTRDTLGNINIDLLDIDKNGIQKRDEKKAFKNHFSKLLKENAHLITVKVSHKHPHLSKYIKEAGFISNHSNADFTFYEICLKKHTKKDCVN